MCLTASPIPAHERVMGRSKQRWFAKYEFNAPYLFCCSDCEPMTMKELLAMGDEDSLQRWENLSLGYTESAGLPALLTEIAR